MDACRHCAWRISRRSGRIGFIARRDDAPGFPAVVGVLPEKNGSGRYQAVLRGRELSGNRQNFRVHDDGYGVWSNFYRNLENSREKKENDPAVPARFLQCTLRDRRDLLRRTILAICDAEEAYAEKLGEYFKEKQGIPFEILTFTDSGIFWSFLEQKDIGVALLGEGAADRKRLETFKGCAVVLTDGSVSSELLRYPSVCKYQSCDQIFEAVLKIYAGHSGERPEKPVRLLKKETRLLAVYSPVRRCGKTGFAITAGQVLAEQRPVLYLNLEPVSGYGNPADFEDQADLSDLIYLFRQNRSNFLYQLGAAAKKIRKLDYIPPGIGWDLAEMKTEEWIDMIKEIFQYSTYEVIILDVDESVKNLPKLLNFCEKIYMPVLEEETAKEKIEQYERMIKKSQDTRILQKTVKISPPFFRRRDLEALFFGEMGNFARELLKGE